MCARAVHRARSRHTITSACVYCSVSHVNVLTVRPGKVKVAVGDSATCIAHTDGSFPCNDNQKAEHGVCTNCPSGQVATNDHVRCAYCSVFDSGCSLCAPGKVKIPVDDSATCVAYTDGGFPCNDVQFAEHGVCKTCTDGRVANEQHTACVTPSPPRRPYERAGCDVAMHRNASTHVTGAQS